jgi:hypothetical protein
MFFNTLILFKKNIYYLFIFHLFLLVLALCYTSFFSDILLLNTSESFYFFGVVQSDTFVFKQIFDESLLQEYLDAGVMNILMPVMLWSFLSGDWYLATSLNVLLLFITSLYATKISNLFGFSIGFKFLIFIAFLPETFIYTLGILKEIPSLLLFTMSAYYFLNSRWLYFLLSVFLLLLFRYQFAACFILFFCCYFIFGRYAIRMMLILFIFLSSIYPLMINNISAFNLSSYLYYMDLSGGSGIGESISFVQFNYYILSSFATIIKFFQMMVEPWPFPSIISDYKINVIALFYTISAIIFFPIWYKYFRFLICAFLYPKSYSRRAHALLCLSFSFIFMISFNSFVHHRYLFPGFVLILLVAHIPLSDRFRKSLC